MGVDDQLELAGKESTSNKIKNFNFDEFILKFRWPLTFLLVGVILLGFGVYFAKDSTEPDTKVEVLERGDGSSSPESEDIVVEVVGAVVSPGVYKFKNGQRIEDALIAAGGISADADREWIERFLNRAAKVSDGQKILIPREIQQSDGLTASDEGVYQNGSTVQGSVADNLVNINTATASQLESLWGIGPVYAQNIIEQRPYSTVEELLTKKILKTNVYERNKEYLTIY